MFPQVPIPEVVFFQEGPGLRQWQWTDEGMKVINVTNILADGSVDVSNTDKYISLTEFEEHYSHFSVEESDIVVASSGNTYGKVGRIQAEHLPLMMNTSVVRFHSKDGNRLDNEYLYGFLRSPDFKNQIEQFVIGGAQPNFGPSHIKKMWIYMPRIDVQRKIGDILSAYDNLIANNRRRIQLLEQAARHIYKEWFVRLRFPGHEHTRIVDGVPVGWEKSTNGDVCTEFSDGDWIETKDQGGEDYRLLQISNIGENDFVETGNYRYITEETLRRLRCNEVVPGDILIARMPTPIGRAWLVTEMPWRMITAVDVTIARPNPEKVNPFYYLYHLNSENHLAHCVGRAIGATRPRIARKSMAELPILVPTKRLQETFGEFQYLRQLRRAKLSSRVVNATQASHLTKNLRN